MTREEKEKLIGHLKYSMEIGADYLITDEDAVEIIKALEQEPKTGHWIELGCVGNDNYDFECSECHHTDTQSKTVKVNYCWYCGAKMIVPQEVRDKE